MVRFSNRNVVIILIKHIEIDYVNAESAISNEFDATKVIEHMHEVYQNQVFAEGQRFAVSFEADMLIARVVNLAVHNTLELAKPEVDCTYLKFKI